MRFSASSRRARAQSRKARHNGTIPCLDQFAVITPRMSFGATRIAKDHEYWGQPGLLAGLPGHGTPPACFDL